MIFVKPFVSDIIQSLNEDYQYWIFIARCTSFINEMNQIHIEYLDSSLSTLYIFKIKDINFIKDLNLFERYLINKAIKRYKKRLIALLIKRYKKRLLMETPSLNKFNNIEIKTKAKNPEDFI